MKTITCLGVACVVLTAAIGACGNGGETNTTEGTGDTGTGGQVTTAASSSASTTAGTGGASTSSSSASSTSSTTATTSSGSGGASVNGCMPSAATDLTGMAAVTITFGDALGEHYDHPCIKVTAGTMVTFSGSFGTHPLGGGDMPPTQDALSPIAATTTGTSATFTLPTAGTYGYFCAVHYSSGMEGAIVVE